MHFHTSDRASFPLYSLLSFCFTSQISSVLNRIVIHPVRGINQHHQPIKAAFLKSQKTGQCPLISTGGQRYTKIRFIKYDVAFHRSLFHKGAVDTFFKMEQIRCFRDPLRRYLQSSSFQTGDRTINRLSIHIPKQAALHIQPVHLQRHTGGILFRQFFQAGNEKVKILLFPFGNSQFAAGYPLPDLHRLRFQTLLHSQHGRSSHQYHFPSAHFGYHCQSRPM